VGSWLVVCEAGTAGYCTANAKLTDGRGGAQGYAFQLHVWRARAGDALQVTFLAGGARPAAGEPMQLRVDELQPVTLEAGTGYRSVRSGGAYVLTAREPVTALLTQMLGGKRLRIAYRDTQGNPVAAVFSLNGFKQAVARFEGAAVAQMLAAKRASPPPVPEAARRQEPEATPGQTRPPAAGATEPSDANAIPEPVQRNEPAPVPPPPRIAATASRAQSQPSSAREPATPSSAGGKRRAPATVTEVAPAQTKLDAGSRTSRKKGRESVREFACRGSEPTWSLAIDHEHATLRLLDGEPAAQELSGKFSISGEGRTPIMTWKGKAAGERSGLTAVIVEQACQDSLSRTEGQTGFAYQTQVTLPDGRKVRGCCSAGLPAAATPSIVTSLDSARTADFAAKSGEDWARLLPELKPAIDACLARTPGPSPYVTIAWPLDAAMAGVRTRSGDGGWFGCIARIDGSVVDRFEPLPRGEPPLPGENLTLFTPSGGIPRAGACWEQERVLDAAGKLLGHLSYNIC
jgi:uncharacterized membrane protein/invasion protein IalB